MVKSLKFLRHRRTEAGYFSEFLIAKTPDDLENREPQQQQHQTIVLAAVPSIGLPAAVQLQLQQQQQLHQVSSASLIDLHAWPVRQEVVVSSAPQLQPPPAPPSKPRASVAGVESYRLARRRERNRAAAAKCRQRRQDRLETLADCVRELEAANDDLEAELAELAQTKAQLEAQIRSHQAHDCRLTDAAVGAMQDENSRLSSPTSPSSPSSVWLAQPPQTPQLLTSGGSFRRPASLSLTTASSAEAADLPSLTTPGGGAGCGSGLTPFLLTPQSAFKLEEMQL